MFHPLKQYALVSRNFSLALLLLLAPHAEANMIMPEEIRIDINSKPEQINFDFELDFGSSTPTTTVDVLFLVIFFATYESDGSAPWIDVGYVESPAKSTSHDLNATLRDFLFEETLGGVTFDIINRVSLNDTYVFGAASEVYYIPNCIPLEDDCPPILAASFYGETLVTFYDSTVEVPLPGSLPLAMIAALGIFWRSRSKG